MSIVRRASNNDLLNELPLEVPENYIEITSSSPSAINAPLNKGQIEKIRDLFGVIASYIFNDTNFIDACKTNYYWVARGLIVRGKTDDVKAAHEVLMPEVIKENLISKAILQLMIARGIVQQAESDAVFLNQYIFNGQTDLAIQLIEAGVNVNRHTCSLNRDGEEITSYPIELACMHGNLQIIKSLVDHGVEIIPKPAVIRFLLQNISSDNRVNDAIFDLFSKFLTTDSTILNQMIFDENFDVALQLIKKGINTNKKSTGYNQGTNQNVTCLPIEIACIKGNWDVVKALIQKGAQVDIHSFRRAVEKGHFDLAERLVHLIDPNQQDNTGKTVLHYAPTEGIASDLIENGANNLPDHENTTPLFLFLRSESPFLDAAEKLILKKENLDCEDADGQTVLCLCIENGWEDLAQTLIENGARTDLAGEFGEMPLEKAYDKGLKFVVNALLEMGATNTLLEKAVKKGDREMLARCLQESGDFKKAFELAILHNQMDLASSLYKEKKELVGMNTLANDLYCNFFAFLIQNPDYNPTSLLLGAIGKESTALVTQLLTVLQEEAARNRPVNLRFAGFTFLDAALAEPPVLPLTEEQQAELMFAAAATGNIVLVHTLQNFGLKLDIRNEKGQNLLHVALKSRNGEMASALIQSFEERHVDSIKQADKDGITPLHWAAHIGDKANFIRLIELGADLSAKNGTDNTPLHWACSKDRQSLIEYVIDNVKECPAFNIKNSAGKTPAQCTRNEDIQDMIKKPLLDKLRKFLT